MHSFLDPLGIFAEYKLSYVCQVSCVSLVLLSFSVIVTVLHIMIHMGICTTYVRMLHFRKKINMPNR